MRSVRILSVVFTVLLFTGLSNTYAQNLGASFRVGTEGIGVGLTTGLAPTVNARVDVHYFTYSTDGNEVVDDISVDYDAEGDLFFVSALADWHPFRNAFRVSGGAVYNGLEGRGGVVPVEDIEVGRNTFTPEEVGELNIDVSFGSKIAPYFGIGVGNPLGKRLGFLFDLGVIYAGSPDVNIDATEMLTPTESEAAQIEENLEWVQWYPVLSLGFHVRLN